MNTLRFVKFLAMIRHVRHLIAISHTKKSNFISSQFYFIIYDKKNDIKSSLYALGLKTRHQVMPLCLKTTYEIIQAMIKHSHKY